MSWEIIINWDECPYLKEVGTPPLRELRCNRGKNRKCNEKYCPIKKIYIKKGQI